MKLSDRSCTLVLGGGGIRGLAHVGVLEAMEEFDLVPKEIVGSSIGSLIAAAWCSGTSIAEMKEIAFALRRSDVFQVAHRDMAFKRMRSPALYRRSPLRALIRGLLGNITFQELERPLIVNTVDINSGTQVFWGTPGLDDIPVADAVFASCALPGFLPPQEIRGGYYVDGAATANLPVSIAAARKRDLVIAVDVGSSGMVQGGLQDAGFASIYARAQEIAILTMKETKLAAWETPPLILLQPRIGHVSMFSFEHNEFFVAEGNKAAFEVLSRPDQIPGPEASGVYPRRAVNVRVDPERCIGCGACLVHGPPGLFEINGDGKALVTEPEQEWSPTDGGYVRQCPTYAIIARADRDSFGGRART